MTITKQAPKTKTTRQAPSLGGTARRSPSNDLRAAANPNCFLRRAVAQSLTEHRKRSSELHTAAKAAAVRMLEDAAGQLKTKIGRVKASVAKHDVASVLDTAITAAKQVEAAYRAGAQAAEDGFASASASYQSACAAKAQAFKDKMTSIVASVTQPASSRRS